MAETMEIINSSRSGCALQGALAALSEIRGAIPIVHAGAGCAAHRHIADRRGAPGEGAIGGFEVPSTNVFEKQVIFGGGSRLREQIKNTVKTVNGSLYVVLGSCESAMVGDDIAGMAREAAEQGERVIASDVAGFHGTARQGYVRVLKDIIDAVPGLKMPFSPEPAAAAVNVFGIVPREDVRFKGDLFELKRILEGLGLCANVFFGAENGGEQLNRVPAARLNLLFSKWGREIGERLQSKYGTPSIAYPALPCGFEDVALMVSDITGILKLEQKSAGVFIQREKECFEYFLRSIREKLYGEIIGKSVAVVGSEGEVRQIGGFLSLYFGATVGIAIVTDGEGQAEKPEGCIKNYIYTNDAKRIRCLLEESKTDVIFASALEKGISDGFVEFSYPVFDNTVLLKTYTGTMGGIFLAEDFISAVRRKHEADKIKLVRAILQNNVKQG